MQRGNLWGQTPVLKLSQSAGFQPCLEERKRRQLSREDGERERDREGGRKIEKVKMGKERIKKAGGGRVRSRGWREC